MTTRRQLLTAFNKMPARRQAAICTRIFLAVFLVIAGLIKIAYL